MSASETTPNTVKPVVTIFEYYGAGGDYVGHQVAEALGLPFHQQAFTSAEIEAAQSNVTDQGAVLAQVFSVLGGAYGGFDGREVATTQRRKYDLVMDNNRQVWTSADEGGVILGRNGAVILADRPNTLHVLLTGAVEDRIARAARDAGITPEQAAQRQVREDQVRANMSQAFYGWDPMLPDRYDLVMNTSRVPLDAIVAAIVEAVKTQG
ncbi:MAG: AAA family ATPase [Candidatus Nanopelagicales bacterium]